MESWKSKRGGATCETPEDCSKCGCLLGKGWCEACIASVDPEKAARLAREQRKRDAAAAAQKRQRDAEEAELAETREAERLGWVPNFAEGNSDTFVTAAQFLAAYVPPAAAAAVVVADVVHAEEALAPQDAAASVVLEAKKRGRPKGSKNKTHLLSAGGDADGDDAPPPPAGRRTRPVLIVDGRAARGGVDAEREDDGGEQRHDAAGEFAHIREDEKEVKAMPWVHCDTPATSVARDKWVPEGADFEVRQSGARMQYFADCDTERDFIKRFLSQELFTTIADATNLAGARLYPGGRWKWTEFTRAEFYAYICVVYEMGLSDVPSIKDYWSTGRRRNHVIVDMIPSYHRFYQISRAMRCMDFGPGAAEQENWQAASREHGPFAKTAAFAECLSASFQEAYQLEQFISLDEQSVPTKCRHVARQFNKDKPFHFFLKVFALNSAVTGFLWKFYFYKGAAESRPAPFNKEGLAHSYPVHALTEDASLHHKGHIIALDNWYMSLATAEVLLTRGINFVGTVQAGRLGYRQTVSRIRKKKAVQEVIKTIIDPGESSHANPPAPRGTCAQATLSKPGKIDKNANFTFYATSWLDNKVVQMLHSFQSPLVTCSRRIDGVSHTIQQPASIALYNRVMGGTDLNDQMIRYYSRMSKAKWTSKVFNHLFHVTAYNAFICHRQLTKSANDFKTFMENVVTQFHNAHTLYHSRKRPDGQSPLSPPKPRPNASTLMLQSGRACDWAERHHLEADPAGVKKCVMCTKEGKRFRCVTRCSNEELCRNAHVCIQHFVAFHNASPIAKIDAGSSDEE